MPNRDCQVCAQPFAVQYESNRKRTCSRHCSALLAARSRPQNQKRPDCYEERTCRCGGTFQVLLSREKGHSRVHCSLDCQLKYRRAGSGRPLGDRQQFTKDGYRMVYVPQDSPWRPAPRTTYILEHRLVMAQHIGRPLLPGENVHHRNGDKIDNRIENLELWVTPPRPGQRVSDLLAHARYIIDTYSHLEGAL